jgi:hypothetical protein
MPRVATPRVELRASRSRAGRVTIRGMQPAVPFRWDVTRRDQLGALVGAAQPPECAELLTPLLPCAARVLAFAGDADLTFVGRSPESLFDLLSGLLFDTSWFERLSLLHFSMRWTDLGTIDAEHPQAIGALRSYLQTLALDPGSIATRPRPVALVDWVQTGGTFGNLVEQLRTWSDECGQDWSSVRRRLRIVGITERTHNSPNTWRWHQHADWMTLMGSGRVKNVSMHGGWWNYFAQRQSKVSPSHTPARWAVEDIATPGRDSDQLQALREAHGLFELGRLDATRAAISLRCW